MHTHTHTNTLTLTHTHTAVMHWRQISSFLGPLGSHLAPNVLLFWHSHSSHWCRDCLSPHREQSTMGDTIAHHWPANNRTHVPFVVAGAAFQWLHVFWSLQVSCCSSTVYTLYSIENCFHISPAPNSDLQCSAWWVIVSIQTLFHWTIIIQ